MIKFNQLMKAGVGNRFVSYTGREAFRVEDEDFRKSLKGLGIFEDGEEPGTLRYSGAVTVPLKDGTTKAVDPRGFLAAEKSDLADETGNGFL